MYGVDEGEVEEEGEDGEEVEAWIKKRVKEGSGRDYEAIIKKDIVQYKRKGEAGDLEAENFSKYENSRQYKQLHQLVSQDLDSLLTQPITNELSTLASTIQATDSRLQTLLKDQ